MTDYKKFISLIDSFEIYYVITEDENFISVLIETDDYYSFYDFDKQTETFCGLR